MSGRGELPLSQPEADAVDRPSGRRGFAGVAALALIIRVAWLVNHRHVPLGGDPLFYHLEANLVADGRGFIEPISALAGQSIPNAAHPPLFVLYLALWSLVGADSPLWHQFAGALLGTASVLVLAETGRRIGGERVGLVAGFLAAVAPNLWLWDGLVAAESMAIFAVSLFLYFVVRYRSSPTRLGLMAVAGSATLAGLSRAEFILLVLAVIPLIVRTRDVGARLRATWLLAAVLVVALLLAPWVAYNQSRFDEPVVLSTGLGLVMVSSACDETWYGSLTGYWSFDCSVAGTLATGGTADPQRSGNEGRLDDSELDVRMRSIAWDYINDHRSRAPVVVAARMGRVTGLYQPLQQARLGDSYEGAPRWIMGSIMSTWYLLAALAIIGGRTLRRAAVPLLAICSPLLVVLLTTAITYGIGRFRAPADPVVILLAAVGVDHVAARSPNPKLAR